MPRFFFSFKGGRGGSDEVSVDLPDMTAVRVMAVRASGEAISELGIRFRDFPEWELRVVDETGVQVLKLGINGVR